MDNAGQALEGSLKPLRHPVRKPSPPNYQLTPRHKIDYRPDSWERGSLVVASIVNVPLFLLALFVLQTRFRAELQEDTFYAEYLSKKTSAIVRIDRETLQDSRIDELSQHVARLSEQVTHTMSTDDRSNSGSLQTSLDWSHWPVAVNDLHPRAPEILDALRASGIPVTELFGAADDVPKKWIVSISRALPLSHKIHVLRALMPFELDGIQIWEPNREAEELEDVYIGSYGERDYVAITPELDDILAKPIDSISFQSYCRRHMRTKESLSESVVAAQ